LFAVYCGFVLISERQNISLPNELSLIEFLIFISILIYFFYEKMKVFDPVPLYQSMNFWICVAMFIYFTGSFFFLIVLNNISTASVIEKNQIRIIYGFVTILKNLILVFSFIFCHSNRKDNETALNIPEELHLDSFNPKSTLN